MNAKLAYLAVLLSWILPSKIKLLVQGEFSIYTEGWKLRERFMQKLQVEGKKKFKSQPFKNYTLFIRPRKGLLKAPTCKELPIWFVPLSPSLYSRVNMFKKTILCLQNGSFFFIFIFYFVSDSKDEIGLVA